MAVIKDISDANRVLRAFIPPARSTRVYTLDNIKKFLAFVGNPQDELKVVHIAGTSGKTSTAYFSAAQLKAAGFKVGLTVSPHVDTVTERVQINGSPLMEKQFCRELSTFLELVERSKIELTYYEILVAFAFWEFERQKVDYAVVEVGLGGLLDGTNVVSRTDKVCVITDIGLDHTAVLGNTLDEIAAQKAGIIQPGNQVFSYRQPAAVISVFNKTCKLKSARLNVVEQVHYLAPAKDLPLFQQRNFYLAAEASNFVLIREGRPELTSAQLRQAAGVYIPARMEIVERKGKTLILDGSHNQQKVQVLIKSLRQKFPDRHIAALIALVNDDEPRAFAALDELMKLVDSFIITSYNSQQDTVKESLDPAAVAAYCRAKGFMETIAEPNPAKAYGLLLEQKQNLLLVGGSFYLLNHVRPLIFKA